jgi:hypothetical protein
MSDTGVDPAFTGVIILITALAVIIVMVLLSRMGKQRKKEAVADLEREREAVKAPDIIELIQAEITELGIDRIEGSDSIDPSILLQVYRRDEVICAEDSSLQFVLADGVDPSDADLDTLSLRCDE